MNDKDILQIFAMSGYGIYVWSAFGVTFITLLILYTASRGRLRKALKTLEQSKKSHNK